MKTLRFKVGDLARVVCADFDPPCEQPDWCIGQRVEIIATAASDFNYADYIVRFSNGYESLWDENTLRPFSGDSIPASTLALFTKTQRNPNDVPERVKA